MKVLILGTEKIVSNNKETGEVISYTATQIATPIEATENKVGYVVETITGKVGDFDLIKPYYNKMVDVDFDYKLTDSKKNTYKKKFLKIADTIISNS